MECCLLFKLTKRTAKLLNQVIVPNIYIYMPVRNGNLGTDRTTTTKAASVRKQLCPKNSKSDEGRQAKNGGVKGDIMLHRHCDIMLHRHRDIMLHKHRDLCCMSASGYIDDLA